jgi:hypothetical protein
LDVVSNGKVTRTLLEERVFGFLSVLGLSRQGGGCHRFALRGLNTNINGWIKGERAYHLVKVIQRTRPGYSLDQSMRNPLIEEGEEGFFGSKLE